MARTAKPQISFADWELLQQGILLEPLLQRISDFLTDQEGMVKAVRRDLQRGLKNPGTGRSGLTPQQVLRSLILKHVKNWDFRELRERNRRRVHAAPVHGFLLPAGAEARCLQPRL